MPSGHDAWVEGDEQVVVIDWFGVTEPHRKPTMAADDGTSSAARRAIPIAWLALATTWAVVMLVTRELAWPIFTP